MLDFLTKFFRREESSKSLAKERLRLVLMADRVSLAPDTFDAMKGEMLGVLQRYLEIDEQGLDVHFENAERRFVLLANIPVNNVKTGEQIEEERRRTAVGGNGTGSLTPPRRRRRRRRSTVNGGQNGAAAPTGSSNDAGKADSNDSVAINGTANGRVAPSEQPESPEGSSNGEQGSQPQP